MLGRNNFLKHSFFVPKPWIMNHESTYIALLERFLLSFSLTQDDYSQFFHFGLGRPVTRSQGAQEAKGTASSGAEGDEVWSKFQQPGRVAILYDFLFLFCYYFYYSLLFFPVFFVLFVVLWCFDSLFFVLLCLFCYVSVAVCQWFYYVPSYCFCFSGFGGGFGSVLLVTSSTVLLQELISLVCQGAFKHSLWQKETASVLVWSLHKPIGIPKTPPVLSGRSLKESSAKETSRSSLLRPWR